MSIFERRIALKPLEFPEVMQFVDAINHSYWLVSEFNFISDIQDFHVSLNETERNAIKNTLLAISQIEVSVKTFWGKLYDHFPKPEFNDVGASFSESEVRHQRAYSHLLEVLGLNHDFAQLLEVPVIQRRIDYLSQYLKNAGDNNKEIYTLTLALFSLFIENVSLFSQFVIIKSFNKERNILKDVDNVVQATLKEEVIHGLLGVYIINEIKKEYPAWFNNEFYKKIERAAIKAYKAELGILNWIFEKGELDFLSIDTLDEFIKFRFNESLSMIGCDPIFEVDNSKLECLHWFIEEMHTQTHTDFFWKRPVNYNKKSKAITAEELF